MRGRGDGVFEDGGLRGGMDADNFCGLEVAAVASLTTIRGCGLSHAKIARDAKENKYDV
jgi:hypothetical protein